MRGVRRTGGRVTRARSTRGLAIALAVSLFTGCRPRDRPPTIRPHVLLVTLDTTRADRLGCYGYARRTSPNLDRLAADSRIYTRAIATSSWTLPSHASLFTGKLTSSHGASYDPAGPLSLASVIDGPAEWKSYRARGLGEAERTLAEHLRDAGYETGAVVAGPWMKRPFGLDQGFDYYDDDQIDGSEGRRADLVTGAALRWIERSAGKPRFLFLNYYDPHGPYDPPEPFLSTFLSTPPRGEELSARYDAEILYMDHHLGVLLDRLRKGGLYDDTLIVVTADHGELLGEHGRVGHGHYLTQPEIHVPLLVKPPRREVLPGPDASAVQVTDVFAMILQRVGLPLPPGTQSGLPPRTGHPVVAEVTPLPFNSPDGAWRALFDGSHKFLWNSKGRHQLYDLERDPGEDSNLADREPARIRTLTTLMERYLASLPPPGASGPPRTLDEETRKALRGLGYVE